MTIGVIGGGAFGTALAAVMARDGTHVTLWARGDDTVSAINDIHCNQKRLPDIPLPPSLRATTSLVDLQTSEIILLVLPAQETRPFLEVHAKTLPDVPIALCAKGIDVETMETQSQIAAHFIDITRISVLTGPGFAKEIAQGLPTAVTIAAKDEETGLYVQSTLSRESFRLYLSDDMIGAEVGGAFKNVVALAAGAAIGASFGQSARAALITRGYAEMTRFAVALGGNPQTLSGLCGFGDLILTATSESSRNYRQGVAIGQGEALDANLTTEGAKTARAAVELAQKLNIDAPITTMVDAVLSGKATVNDALAFLLARPLKRDG